MVTRDGCSNVANEYSWCAKIRRLDENKLDIMAEFIKSKEFGDLYTVRTGFMKPEDCLENFLNFGLYKRFNLFTITALEKMFDKLLFVLVEEKFLSKEQLIKKVELSFSKGDLVGNAGFRGKPAIGSPKNR